jgi:hypothetical protein
MKNIGESSSSQQSKHQHQHEQLDSAIDNATNTFDTRNDNRVTNNTVEHNHNNGPSLKQFYSLEHAGKRQKIAIMDDNDNGLDAGSCFGKFFHPME